MRLVGDVKGSVSMMAATKSSGVDWNPSCSASPTGVPLSAATTIIVKTATTRNTPTSHHSRSFQTTAAPTTIIATINGSAAIHQTGYRNGPTEKYANR